MAKLEQYEISAQPVWCAKITHCRDIPRLWSLWQSLLTNYYLTGQAPSIEQ